MLIPGFIMISFYPLLVFISFSISALGVREHILDSIRATYENSTGIKERYEKLRHELNEPGKINPCESWKPQVLASDNTLVKISSVSEVITGDMGQETGFRLILDDLTFVDIPAIIRCIPRFYDDDTTINFDNKEVMYYLVPFGAENNTQFELAYTTEEVKDNKRVFILHATKMTQHLVRTYNDPYNKAAIGKWFKNRQQPKDPTKVCKSIIAINKKDLGIVSSKFKITVSKLVTGSSILRISKNLQINIRGYVECGFNVFHQSKPKVIDRTDKIYFTISNLDNGLKPIEFVRLYGPKNANNKNDPKIFDIHNYH